MGGRLVTRLRRVAQILSGAFARQSAHRALHESEERFRSLFENATLGIYRTTPSGRILAANPTLIRMLGYRDFENLATRNLEKEGYEPGYERKAFCDRMEREGKVIGLESAWVRQDGSVMFVRESAQAIRGPDGKILYYDGIVEDITQRKREEEALRESEARFDQLARQSQTTIWEVDPQGLFTFVSHVSQVAWGYTQDEIVGRMHFYDLHPEEGRETFKMALGAVTGMRRPFDNVVHPVKTKDGRIVWGSVNGAPMLNADGTLRGYRGSCSDITERKHAEDALRLSEAKYRTVIEMTGTGFHILDLQGRVLDANEEFVRLTGHSALSEILGRSVIEWTAEEAKKRNADAITQCAKDGFVRNFVTQYVDREGRATFIEVNATMEGEGSGQRIIALSRDVTERIRHEQAIRNLSGRLISAQEEERTRIARELHDDIMQRIALLAMELTSWSKHVPKSAVDLRDRIHDSKKRLWEMSTDIQALSHHLHSSKLEILGLVSAANTFCMELSEKHGIPVDFVHSDIPRAVPSSISLCLFRVLQQALQNALKHSGSTHVKVELRGTPNEIQLIVSDSGIGFDPKEAINGKGIGLISMQERLGLVDGQFSVTSAPGKGTTIYASVPLGSH
jgi:PAS domain S-box-containing protein